MNGRGAMAVLFVLLTAMTNCNAPHGDAGAGAPPPASGGGSAGTAPVTGGPRIVFPDGYTVGVEVAADDATRGQGLMYRDRMAEDRGMIFIFPEVGEYPFWMKNTLIALDMLWLDDAKRIVHIAHDVPPCKADPCPSYPPNAKARYVLEVNAGVAAKHKLADGQVLRFEGLGNIVPR